MLSMKTLNRTGFLERFHLSHDGNSRTARFEFDALNRDTKVVTFKVITYFVSPNRCGTLFSIQQLARELCG